MEKTAVDVFYENSNALIKYLEENKQPSFVVEVDNNFKKVLLLSAASYFESVITQLLLDFVMKKSNNAPHLNEFLKQRAIGDKYFQLFNWKKREASQFFAFFGKDFKKHIEDKLANDEEIESAISAFLEIGEWRNKIVHQNFAEFDLPKTGQEVFELYQKARKFPAFIHKELCEYPIEVN